jgi:hypothetical protein
LAEFLRGLAIITRPLRRVPDTGEAAGANDAFSLVKWMANAAIWPDPVVLRLKANAAKGHSAA